MHDQATIETPTPNLAPELAGRLDALAGRLRRIVFVYGLAIVVSVFVTAAQYNPHWTTGCTVFNGRCVRPC